MWTRTRRSRRATTSCRSPRCCSSSTVRSRTRSSERCRRAGWYRRSSRPWRLSSAPLDGDQQPPALDISGRGVASGSVVGHRGGKRLASDVGLVGARGGEQLLVATQRQLDAVLDVQPGVLARRLHGVHDLPGETLTSKLLVELEVERHGVSARALDLVAVERLEHDLDVIRADLVLLALDVDPGASARPQA